MTNRREFLQAAAISALPGVGGATASVDRVRTQASHPLALLAFVSDARHPEARRAGARMAARGAAVLAVAEGDVTQLWWRHIGPAWKNQPVAVAGLTERPALFCLEHLAFECGLRVVFHAEHVVHSAGLTDHSLLRGARGAHLSERELKRAGALWPARAADAMAMHRAQAERMRFGPSEAALEPAVPPGAKLLTSWIIAAA